MEVGESMEFKIEGEYRDIPDSEVDGVIEDYLLAGYTVIMDGKKVVLF